MNRASSWFGSWLARWLSGQRHVCSASPATDMDLLARVLQPGDVLLVEGSGDPTRAICSTLIAQCFQAVRYPILPRLASRSADSPECPGCRAEVLKIRHHSLFVPRDFDVSPCFEVVKPTLAAGFDYRRAEWADADESPVAIRP